MQRDATERTNLEKKERRKTQLVQIKGKHRETILLVLQKSKTEDETMLKKHPAN